MKRVLILLAAFVAVLGFVYAAPVQSGENPAFPYHATYLQYDLFCHEPHSDQVNFCKVYEYVEVSEHVFEYQFVSNAHIWLDGTPNGPDDWAWFPEGNFWIRFTPKGNM